MYHVEEKSESSLSMKILMMTYEEYCQEHALLPACKRTIGTCVKKLFPNMIWERKERNRKQIVFYRGLNLRVNAECHEYSNSISLPDYCVAAPVLGSLNITVPTNFVKCGFNAHVNITVANNTLAIKYQHKEDKHVCLDLDSHGISSSITLNQHNITRVINMVQVLPLCRGVSEDTTPKNGTRGM